MTTLNFLQRRGWLLLLLSGMLSSAGCSHHADRFSIPDTYPLGSVVRAHYHTQETNGEATDFIFTRNEFVGNTAELTNYGKDHILEVAARMRSAPYPVIVEREEHNADPELDVLRRNLVAQVLTDMGNQDAQQRTFVSTHYDKARNSQEASMDYYRYLYSRGGNGNNGFGNGNGNMGGGGFGGYGY